MHDNLRAIKILSGHHARHHPAADLRPAAACGVFVERLWKTIKYEEVYLRAYDTVSDARASLTRYIDFYNTRRPHTALDRRTPDEVYFQSLPLAQAA